MENENSEPRKVVDYEEVDKFIKKMMATFTSFMNNYETYVKTFEEYEKQVNLIKEAYKRKVWITLTDKEIQEKIARRLFYSWANWVKLILSTTTETDDGALVIPSIFASELKKLAGTNWEDVKEGNKVVFIDGAHEITRRL